MSQQHIIRSDIKYPLLVSFLGLFLIILLTFFPPEVVGNVLWRKPFVGSIFSIICFLGVFAIFLPNKCLVTLSIGKKNNKSSDSVRSALHGKSNRLQGHHPTCGNYETHIFRIKDSTFCAACAGLLLGAIIALAGSVAYFFDGFTVTDNSLLVWMGVVGVSFGFFQYKFRSLIRLLSNTIFVLGALLVLIGIDALLRSLVLDLFVISLIVFWLYSRISLSQWDHEIICSICNIENCKVSK